MTGQMLSKIFELTPVPSIILDPSLRILSVSTSFLALTKLRAEQCEEVDYLSLLNAEALVLGDNVRLLCETIDVAVGTRAMHTCQHIAPGEDTWRQLRVAPIFEDLTLLYLVLDWQEPIKHDLPGPALDNGLSTTQAFRILVETVKDYAIFLLDTKGNIMTWNAGAQLNKQYKANEIIGKHFSIFYGDEDLKIEKPQKELEICLRDGRVEDEGWRYRKDGSRFWANVLIIAVYDKGVHIGFGKVTRDLTERKNAASRVIAAFEETSKLKSDFLANMSHEIRTPMHGMLSACTLLFDTQLNDEQEELANIIEDSGQILVQVIDDILDYSKLASGGFSLNLEIFQIERILRAVARSFQPTLKPGVLFQYDIAPNLPESVRGDPLRYRQVVQNIVSNASKFTATGFISVHAHIQTEDEGGYYVMTEIADTGIGIPASAESKLFVPFTQFDNTSTKSYKGTGLGLSISKSIVDLMGGEIGSRPNPGGNGTIFWFTAKFDKIKSVKHTSALSEQLTATKLSRPSAGITAHTRDIFRQKSLLLAEDNIINQKVMLKMLHSFGFELIDLAMDGAYATRLALNNPETYDLILMDISMPIVDGIAATAEIRRHGFSMPIVAVTANSADPFQRKGEGGVEREFDDYILKPVKKDILIRVLTKWLVGGDGSE
jgi:osomolarity two-component system sensor histidine kinase TcsA